MSKKMKKMLLQRPQNNNANKARLVKNNASKASSSCEMPCTPPPEGVQLEDEEQAGVQHGLKNKGKGKRPPPPRTLRGASVTIKPPSVSLYNAEDEQMMPQTPP